MARWPSTLNYTLNYRALKTIQGQIDPLKKIWILWTSESQPVTWPFQLFSLHQFHHFHSFKFKIKKFFLMSELLDVASALLFGETIKLKRLLWIIILETNKGFRLVNLDYNHGTQIYTGLFNRLNGQLQNDSRLAVYNLTVHDRTRTSWIKLLQRWKTGDSQFRKKPTTEKYIGLFQRVTDW